MDNYAIALDRARMRFLEYDGRRLQDRPGVHVDGTQLRFLFLGTEASVSRTSGHVVFSLGELTWPADYSEGLAVYDWLCDARPDAAASGEFCPVYALPGVTVGGSGLAITGGSLPERIDRRPEGFRTACAALGGERIPLGDIGFRLPVFPGLSMMLKFYGGDEDFPPSLTFLWDKNTLDFVRYETVYYLAGALCTRLNRLMDGETEDSAG